MDTWEKSLKRVLRFFTRAGGWGYTFCVAEDQRDIVAINQLLKEQLNNQLIFLRLNDDRALVQQFSEAVAAFPDAPIVVSNIEEFLKTNEQERLLELNFSREALNDLRRPILFWITKNRLTQVANEAADLFSQRQFGTLIFPKQTKTDFNNTLEFTTTDTINILSEEESENLSLKAGFLENQLAAAHSFEPAYIAENIALPLALTYTQLYEHDKALQLIKVWEEHLPTEKWSVYFELGEIYKNAGELLAAEQYFSKAAEHLEQSQNDLYNLAVTYQRLGETHNSLGNLDKALDFHKEVNKLFLVIYAAYPTNSNFKNGLAVSYQFLGQIHSSLGNTDKSLAFFEEYNRLSKELYAAYPINIGFKNNLAISYIKLGDTYLLLHTLDKALIFFEKANDQFQQLYALYPTNVDFKYRLSVSYEKVGHAHYLLDNLDMALVFFEKSLQLSKELCTDYPTNVDFKKDIAISYQYLGIIYNSLGDLYIALSYFEYYQELAQELLILYPNYPDFKNGLAISHQYLGEIHTLLGNLDKALIFFEEMNKLFTALFKDYPTNVRFKNGLALSDFFLGDFYKNSDKAKAKTYYLKCKNLWVELTRDFPAYAEFQKNLAEVEGHLKDLE